MKNKKAGDNPVSMSMRSKMTEKQEPYSVSKSRKARDEELEQIRRSKATKESPFKNSDTRSQASDTQSISRKRAVSEFANFDKENFRRTKENQENRIKNWSDNRSQASDTRSISQRRAASESANINKQNFRSNIRRLSGANGTNVVVFNIDDFYREQRKKSNIARMKKDEAAKHRQHYNASILDRSLLSALCPEAKKYAEDFFQKAEKEKLASVTNFFVKAKYKTYIFVTHGDHGMLLLHSTRNEEESHFQIPGGLIEPAEFNNASLIGAGDPRKQLLFASKNAAACLLFKETGIDVRNILRRLDPTPLRYDFECHHELNCEYSKRLFFSLDVTDTDFFSEDDINCFLFDPPFNENASHLLLDLSSEHSGFKFQKDPYAAIEELKKYDGGTCSVALRLALKQKTAKMPDRETIKQIIATIEDENKTVASMVSKNRTPRKLDIEEKNGFPIINNMEAVMSGKKDLVINNAVDNISCVDSTIGDQSESVNEMTISTLNTEISDARPDLIGFTMSIQIPAADDTLLPHQDWSDDSGDDADNINIDKKPKFEDSDANLNLSNQANTSKEAKKMHTNNPINTTSAQTDNGKNNDIPSTSIKTTSVQTDSGKNNDNPSTPINTTSAQSDDGKSNDSPSTPISSASSFSSSSKDSDDSIYHESLDVTETKNARVIDATIKTEVQSQSLKSHVPLNKSDTSNDVKSSQNYEALPVSVTKPVSSASASRIPNPEPIDQNDLSTNQKLSTPSHSISTDNDDGKKTDKSKNTYVNGSTIIHESTPNTINASQRLENSSKKVEKSVEEVNSESKLSPVDSKVDDVVVQKSDGTNSRNIKPIMKSMTKVKAANADSSNIVKNKEKERFERSSPTPDDVKAQLVKNQLTRLLSDKSLYENEKLDLLDKDFLFHQETVQQPKMFSLNNYRDDSSQSSFRDIEDIYSTDEDDEDFDNPIAKLLQCTTCWQKNNKR